MRLNAQMRLATQFAEPDPDYDSQQLVDVSDASVSEYDGEDDETMTDAPTESQIQTATDDDEETIVAAPFTDTTSTIKTSINDNWYDDHHHTYSIPPTATDETSSIPRPVALPTYNTLPLSDDVCRVLFSSEFDSNWVDKYYIDPADLTKITSPKKLEELIAPKVVRIGDILLLPGRRLKPSPLPVRWKKAEITAFVPSQYDKSKKYPDLKMTLENDDREWTFPECHGPSLIVKRMNFMDMQPDTSPTKAWTELVLMRGDRRIGILGDVRNSFHIWGQQKRLWDARRKGHTPMPPKNPKWDRRHRAKKGQKSSNRVGK